MNRKAVPNGLRSPDPDAYLELIRLAKAEDFGRGDMTSEISIPADKTGLAGVVFRDTGVLSGMPIVREVLRVYDAKLSLDVQAADGQVVQAGQRVGVIEGPLRSLLAAERIVLNFLQRLSGIATMTAEYVRAVEGTAARICDTRKTTPGWRVLEKYAVRCGGGTNHRMGLYDAVLIKDNHLAAIGAVNLETGLNEAMERISKLSVEPLFVQVEVDTLEQLEVVLRVPGVSIILLDNMSDEQMRQAAMMRDRLSSTENVQLEASGGINLERVKGIARTGVERISIGALTHSVMPIDIGLDLE